MSLLAKCKSWFGSVLSRGRMEREMDAELKFHVANYADDLVRSGIAREEAERLARVEFGGAEPVKEECRQALGLRLADEVLQDLRYATRMLRKSPGFAALAVLTLSVGIGANTAIFSAVNAFILRPLPYPDPDRLLAIWSTDQKRLSSPSSMAARGLIGTSAADLYDWRRPNDVFEDICGWNTPLFTLMRGNEPQQVTGARVNAGFFRMMGVNLPLGRSFLPEEDEPGAAPVAILSDELWHDLFAANPSVLGSSIPINGVATNIVGIMPPGFHLALTGRAGVWMPLALSSADRANRAVGFLNVIGRTKKGVRLERANEYLKTVSGRLKKTYPITNSSRGVRAVTLQDEIGRRTAKEPAMIVFGLVGCVLLIACTNVANLIVGRALRRQQEMAVRLAIGAGRFRLLRQLLTENLLLFLMAGGLSIAFSEWGVRWIDNAISYDNRAYLPNQGMITVDVETLLYTFGIALFAGLVFGFAPAFHCWRVDVNHGLKGTSSRASGSASGARVKNVLVVVQMSLALVVVVASGLMVKAMMRMYGADPGFPTKGLVTARVVLSDAKYNDLTRSQTFFDSVLDRVRPMPGVKVAGAANFVPFTGSNRTTPYAVDGMPEGSPGDRPSLLFDSVTPGYLEALGIPLLRGRWISAQDRAGSERVAVINETMARRHWPHSNPIGQRVRYGAKLGGWFTVAGVVPDVEGQTELGISQPQAYVPLSQSPVRSMTLAIRSASGISESEIYGHIRRAVHETDPGQAVYSVRTMDDLRSEMFNPFAVAGTITALFGVVSAFLAAIGIYGVMAYAVAARRKEFGIRMALGATRGQLLGMVAGQGMKLAGWGLAVGLAGSLATTRLMTTLLYNVSPTDLPAFLLTGAFMLAVAGFACYLPARQASTVDPARVLHYE